jgi:hypothetical protein
MSKKSINENSEKNLQVLSKLDNSTIVSMIGHQWEDIHHSRRQDWLYWTILTVIITGIFTIFKSFKMTDVSLIFIINTLICFGIIISIWASRISWSHWLLHIRKLGYISWLEKFLCIEVNKRNICLMTPTPKDINGLKKLRDADKYVVNGLIYSMYKSIAIMLALCLILFNVIMIPDFKNILSTRINIIVWFGPVIGTIIFYFLLKIIHSVSKKKTEAMRDRYLEALDTYQQ